MLLIAIALNLLVVYAGATLLARTQREVPGRFYKFISRFIIVTGLLGILSAGSLVVFHLCGPCHHHCKSHGMMYRMRMPYSHRVSEAGHDSISQLHRKSRCCPHAYCPHAGEYGTETIFYPDNCVCCQDKEPMDSLDTLQ